LCMKEIKVREHGWWTSYNPYEIGQWNLLKWGGEDVKRKRWWGHLINVQYKPIWNCHSEPLLYDEYILIKKFQTSQKKKEIKDNQYSDKM
jgi:hypothetical protein